MSLKGTTVTPDKRKGLVYVQQTDDSLIHFCWKDRTSGNVEDVSVSAHISWGPPPGPWSSEQKDRSRPGRAPGLWQWPHTGGTSVGSGVAGLLPSGAVCFAHGPS